MALVAVEGSLRLNWCGSSGETDMPHRADGDSFRRLGGGCRRCPGRGPGPVTTEALSLGDSQTATTLRAAADEAPEASSVAGAPPRGSLTSTRTGLDPEQILALARAAITRALLEHDA